MSEEAKRNSVGTLRTEGVGVREEAVAQDSHGQRLRPAAREVNTSLSMEVPGSWT